MHSEEEELNALINTLGPSNAYMHQWTQSSLGQLMA